MRLYYCFTSAIFSSCYKSKNKENPCTICYMSSENGSCPSHLCPVVISPLSQVTWLVHVDVCTGDNASPKTAVSFISTKVNGSFFIGNKIDQTKIFSPSAASSLSLFLTAPPITFQWTLKHGASQGGSGPQRT